MSKLGRDRGKYSFCAWTLAWKPRQAGPGALLVRAQNVSGQTQPMEPLWNPSDYMRNVVEQIRVNAV